MQDGASRSVAASPVFADAAAETLARLQAGAALRRLAKDELLFGPEDPSDHLYLVQTGRLRVWAMSDEGAEITLNILGPGALCGEIGALDGGPRTSGVSAAEPTEILALRRALLMEAVESDPVVCRRVIALLCERLRWVSARMEDSALRSGPSRLARLLLHLCDDYGEENAEGAIALTLSLTQSELARFTQMSRESLNKILRKLDREGLVTQKSRKIVVQDRDRLEALADDYQA